MKLTTPGPRRAENKLSLILQYVGCRNHGRLWQVALFMNVMVLLSAKANMVFVHKNALKNNICGHKEI